MMIAQVHPIQFSDAVQSLITRNKIIARQWFELMKERAYAVIVSMSSIFFTFGLNDLFVHDLKVVTQHLLLRSTAALPLSTETPYLFNFLDLMTVSCVFFLC